MQARGVQPSLLAADSEEELSSEGQSDIEDERPPLLQLDVSRRPGGRGGTLALARAMS